ncbi:MAG TPA: TetR/AcrR family transcriptional regulator [Chthoniobacterales bacterium]|jgi:AcrR family transcriptional regulator|nr:TetR/AcrR family transcriptional regulator [Chthoniobacterales bacterium]
MQVTTCIDKPDPSLARRTRSYGDLTRRRILEAAEKVFSRDGFQGATTREIAREAQVNEVTLFRHFRSRDELLRETILYRTITPEELLNPEAAWKSDLSGQLEQYVRKYYAFLLEREALVRAVVGEGRLLPPAVRETVLKKMTPMRIALIERLQVAQKAGCIRQDVDLGCAVDILRDTVHTGMLRHTAYGTGGYPVDTYLRTVVALFIQGIRKSSAKNTPAG